MVTEGIAKEMDHQYYWQVYIGHYTEPPLDPMWMSLIGCGKCHLKGNNYPINYVHAFARKSSTVVGSSYGAANVNCEGMSGCP